MNVTDRKKEALQLTLVVFFRGTVSVPQEVVGETMETPENALSKAFCPMHSPEMASEKEIRGFLARIVDAEYCGDALVAGIIHGEDLCG